MSHQRDDHEQYVAEADAINAAARALSAHVELPASAAAQIIREHGIVEQIRIPVPQLPEGASPALFNPLRWVIRNEDLLSLANFLDLLKGSISLVIAATTSGTAAASKLIVDGVYAFYGTFKRIIDKGARLSPDEFAVFRALKTHGPATPDALSRVLDDEGYAISAAVINEILQKYARNADRGFTKPVGDGRWELDGV